MSARTLGTAYSVFTWLELLRLEIVHLHLSVMPVTCGRNQFEGSHHSSKGPKSLRIGGIVANLSIGNSAPSVGNQSLWHL